MASAATPTASRRWTKALDGIREYWVAALAERRGESEPREGDLASHLLHSTFDDRPLTDAELLDMLTVLVLAGLDTTRATLGYIFWHLATHPDHRRRLVEEPELIPTFVEEALRYYPIVFGDGRKVTRDTEFYGVQLKQGDMVYALVAGANRDPRAYEQADEFVVDRKRNNHMGFANGPHRCLGMHLARRELSLAVEEWLRVIPDFHIAAEAPLSERGGGVDDDADAAAAGVGGDVVRLTVDAAELHGPRPLLPDGSGPAGLRRRGLRHDPRPDDRRPGRSGRGRRGRGGDVPGAGDHADPMTARAAVIGAGPSGFYAADQLLKGGVAVDLFDALPTPYGLVRAGVAPDHPKIKSVTRMYERTAQHAAFRFFGGVEVGADVTADELRERYHAVVYAVGTPTDNRLGIPGDDRPGSVAATQFVAWYNGHPGHADEAFDLSCSRAVVIGNGNVAIDVARMLRARPRRARGDRHRRPRDRGVRRAPPSPRWSSSGAGGRRRPRSRTPSCASWASSRVPTSSSSPPTSTSRSPTISSPRRAATWRSCAAMPSGRRPGARTGSCCASAARRSRSLGDGEHGPVTGLRVVRNRLEDGRAVRHRRARRSSRAGS